MNGSSVHLQARILELAAIPSSRGSWGSPEIQGLALGLCTAGSLYHLSHQGSPPNSTNSLWAGAHGEDVSVIKDTCSGYT